MECQDKIAKELERIAILKERFGEKEITSYICPVKIYDLKKNWQECIVFLKSYVAELYVSNR